MSHKNCIVACVPREDGDFDVVAELKPNRGCRVPIMRENLDDRLLKEGLALYQFVFFKGDFSGVDVVREAGCRRGSSSNHSCRSRPNDLNQQQPTKGNNQ
jgi:hypothetical protein